MLVNLMVILAVSFWGLSFVANQVVLKYLTPAEIITVRLLLGTPILFTVAKFKGLRFDFKPSDRHIIIIAAIILGAHFLIQTLGQVYTTATNTAWLIATVPAFVAVLSRLVLKESLTWRKISGIILGTCGVLLLVSGGDFKGLDWLYSIGDWLILSTCITWSIYTIVTRNITRRYNPLSLIVVILAIPMIILTVVTIIFTPFSKFYSLPLQPLLLLIFLGVFCLGLAHWFWLEGLSKKGAVEVGAFLYLEPIVTMAAAGPFLGEPLTGAIILSAIMIIAGVYLVERRKKKHNSINRNNMSND